MDVLVLGGGPGGYVTALRAAQLGLKTALVEASELGGVCLNKGCIPSKTFLTAAELFDKIAKAGEWGIEIPSGAVWNVAKLLARKEAVVLKMRQGLEGLCQKRKITLLRGRGELCGPGSVKVGGEILRAEHVVIATGSAPRMLDFGIRDRSKVFFSEEALMLRSVPQRLLILGAGPEGCEFAMIYRGLGSRVTLIEKQDRVLPGFDRDAAAALRRVLTGKGIEILAGESVGSLDDRGKWLEAKLVSGRSVETDAVLVSAGRVPNTSGIGLETADIRCDARGAVIVNDSLETSTKGVYAVGDVTGRRMMAHAASHEGYWLAGKLQGRREALDLQAIPSCAYTYPEVAEVGSSEEVLGANNTAFETGRFSFMALGRAHAKGEPEGFVKILGDPKTGTVLGGVVVGQGASDLISLIGLAIQKRLTVDALRTLVAPHPSASEAVAEAAHLFFREGLHVG